MKFLQFFIFIFYITPYITSGQSISISYGTAFTLSKPESAIINAKSDFSNTTYFGGLQVEYFIPKTKFSIYSNYCKFDGYTFIKFQNGGYVNSFGSIIEADGFSGVEVKRVDLVCNYIITKNKSPFFVKTGCGIGIQSTKTKGNEFGYDPIIGPDYVATSPMEAIGFNTFQVLPVGSLDIGVRFFKRIELGFLVQGVYGFKPYQRQTLKYTYKGISQPDAVYIADGTGIFFSLKVGYRFVKLLKE